MLGQPLSKASLKHVCIANAYEAPDFSKWLNKFTDMTHSIAMSKPNQFQLFSFDERQGHNNHKK